MKKYFVSVFFVFSLFSISAVGFDYGLTLDSYSGLNIDNSNYLLGYEKVSIYTSLKLSDGVGIYADGFYKFSYKSNSSDDYVNIFDVATFLMSVELGNADLQVGRQYFGDYSGDILGHTLDGLSLAKPLFSGVVYINAGYSGYIHRDEYSLVKTVYDISDDNERERVRLVIEGMDFVKDFDLISYWLSAYAYQDIRPENFIDNSGLYFGGGIHGSLTPDLFYALRGNFKTGFFPYNDGNVSENSGALILAGMGAFSMDWYIRNPLSPSISFDVGVSSGDKDLTSSKPGVAQDIDGSSLYSPMVTTGPGLIYSISNQNLTYGKLTASIAPFQQFQAQLVSTVFFRTIEGVTGDDNVLYDSDGHYLGTECSLTFNYRPFSDLGMSLSSGVFIPNDSVMISDEVLWITSLYVSLSL